ncbi:MAG: urease accessory protein UreD [Acidobacteria bacterium]|nr:urease accessory protein UreD [Acidobacteriota bacterium]
MSRAYATSPLRLLMPRNHGNAAWVYTSSFGGGLVDGDCLVLDIDIAPGAAAFVSSQASTKVYRSARGTSVEVYARVGREGLLVAAPDPVVCFAAARYQQVQQFELIGGGSLILVDWLSSGRHGSGERWAFDDYRSRIRVRQDGALVVHDSIGLRAEDGDLAERLGRFDVIGMMLLLGETLREPARTIVDNVAGIPLTRRADELVAATPVRDGCLLRFAGTSVERVSRMLREYLEFVPRLLGDDPWARKW